MAKRLVCHSGDALAHILRVLSMTKTGDVAECGVASGGLSVEMLEVLTANRTLHLFDTFSGHLPETYWQDYEREATRLATPPPFGTLEDVLEAVSPWSNWQIHQGLFAETFPKFVAEVEAGRQEPLALIYADGDLYQSTVEIIEFAHRVLRVGGLLLLHDYFHPQWPGVTKAVREKLGDQYFFVRLPPSTLGIAVRLRKDT